MRRLATAVAALAISAGGAAPALATPTTPSWVATWGIPVNSSKTTSFSNRTIRVLAQTSLGGSQVRVRLSNDNGTAPITLSDLQVGLAGTGAAISGANVPLTVGGAGSVTIPAGASVISDPTTLHVPDHAVLAVSVFTAGNTGRGTGDNEIASYYTATGDHAADTAATSFGGKAAGGWFVTGVDVYTPNDGAIVGFGDSITAGYNAGGNGWPYWLSANLASLAASGGPRVGIVNMGISGNEVTLDRAGYGVSALHRWQRDALSQTGVRLILMMEGINDLGANAVPAASIEAAYQTLQQQAQAVGVNLLVSPLTPSGDAAAPASLYGGDYSTPLGIQIRRDFNAWLKSSTLSNPLLDFAAAVQNPADPDELLPADDSGDRLHPSTAGQQAMANSLDLHSPAFARALTFSTSATGGVGGTVGATLSLALGAPATFGPFTPGVAADYLAGQTATVTSSAGDATLAVADPSATATGHLVNGAFSLPHPLQVSASSPAGTGAALAAVGGTANPTSVLTYAGPVANDPVSIGFRQSIAAGDALRTGSYAKTLTFTLSTTSP